MPAGLKIFREENDRTTITRLYGTVEFYACNQPVIFVDIKGVHISEALFLN
jgi:hypothetical protein